MTNQLYRKSNSFHRLYVDIISSGGLAHTAGRTTDVNPWPPGSQQRAAWMAGWVAAQIRALPPIILPILTKNRRKSWARTDIIWSEEQRVAFRRAEAETALRSAMALAGS